MIGWCSQRMARILRCQRNEWQRFLIDLSIRILMQLWSNIWIRDETAMQYTSAQWCLEERNEENTHLVGVDWLGCLTCENVGGMHANMHVQNKALVMRTESRQLWTNVTPGIAWNASQNSDTPKLSNWYLTPSSSFHIRVCYLSCLQKWLTSILGCK